MNNRLDIIKTYKLFIDGKFPRSESGRTITLSNAKGDLIAHVCRASRKDLRDATTAARKALEPWRNASAYLRGQILYRMAEMLEGKRDEFAHLLSLAPAAKPRTSARAPARPARASAAFTPEREVSAAIDRLIAYAGWADKYAQVLGCNNAVVGPYYNFSVPEPTGVVGVIAPDAPALLGLVALLAPVIVSGNTAIVQGGETPGASLVAATLGEVLATSDVPAGVVNLLTGTREELVPVFAGHRDIDAIHAGGVDANHAKLLREGSAENLKRVLIRELDMVAYFDAAACESPWWIEPFVETKTIWHPSAM